MEQQRAIQEVLGWQKEMRGPAVKPSLSPAPESLPSAVRKAPAAHTYDKGYNKWESFDVVSSVLGLARCCAPCPVQDAALKELDDGGDARTEPAVTRVARPRPAYRMAYASGETEAARDAVSVTDVERERGNKLFAEKQFVQAELAYSRAITADPSSAPAWGNRAMARLKTDDPKGAEADASVALGLLGWQGLDAKGIPSWRFDPDNKTLSVAGKCLLRRSVARQQLGWLDDAASDAAGAMALNQSSAQAASQLRGVWLARRNSFDKSDNSECPIDEVQILIVDDEAQGSTQVTAHSKDASASSSSTAHSKDASAPSSSTAHSKDASAPSSSTAHSKDASAPSSATARSDDAIDGASLLPEVVIAPPARSSPGSATKKPKKSKKRKLGGFEFEAAWLHCASEQDRWNLLLSLDSGGVGACFRRSGGSAIDGELAGGILATIANRARAQEERAAATMTLEGLLSAPGWDVTQSMLDSAARSHLEAIKAALGGAERLCL
jgi:tetratricopeptide (TPR) repeat protein